MRALQEQLTFYGVEIVLGYVRMIASRKSQTMRKVPLDSPSMISEKVELTIGSCFSVHYRVMEHAGSLESTKEA